MCFSRRSTFGTFCSPPRPLALVTMAQFNVLMVRGFDVSVGAVISLAVVIGSFLIAEDMGAGLILLGALVCVAVGVVVGLTNGALVRYVGINSVITTIAMLSVVQGIALYLAAVAVRRDQRGFHRFLSDPRRLHPGVVLCHSRCGNRRRYMAISHAQRLEDARRRFSRRGRQAQRRARRFRPHARLPAFRRDCRAQRLVRRLGSGRRQSRSSARAIR